MYWLVTAGCKQDACAIWFGAHTATGKEIRERGVYATFVRAPRVAVELYRRETRARLPPFPRAFGFSWRRELHAIRAGFECCALPKAFVPPEKSA